MKSSAAQFSERTLDRLIRVTLAVVVLAFLALAAYYVNDRYRAPNVSLVDQEMQRIEAQVRQDPTNVAARIAVADAYFAKGQYDQAIAQYGEALAINPEHQGALLGIGFAYQRKGDLDQAVDYFSKIVELNRGKDIVVSNRRLQMAYYQLGAAYFKQGKLELAAESLRSVLTIDRTDADAIFLLGNVMAAQGNYSDAVDAYRVAIAFVPDFKEAYQAMAEAYQKQGDAARARFPRAMLTLIDGDTAGGIRQLEAVVAQVADVEALYALGQAYEQSDQKDKAIDLYRRTLAASPEHRPAESALGRLGGR